MYAVHLMLDHWKARIVDLVIIELFSLCVTAEALRANGD